MNEEPAELKRLQAFMLGEESFPFLHIEKCLGAAGCCGGKRAAKISKMQAFLDFRSMREGMQEAGIKAVTRAHCIDAGDGNRYRLKSLSSLKRYGASTTQLQNHGGNFFGQFLRGRLGVRVADDAACLRGIGKKHVNVAKRLKKWPRPLIRGIVVRVERRR